MRTWKEDEWGAWNYTLALPHSRFPLTVAINRLCARPRRPRVVVERNWLWPWLSAWVLYIVGVRVRALAATAVISIVPVSLTQRADLIRLASLAVLVAVAAVFDSLVLCSVMSQWPSCVDVFVLDDISESEQCSFQRKWCVMHLTPLGCHEQRCARASANPIIIQPTTGAHSTLPSSVHWALDHWSWSSTTIWDAFPVNNHRQWLFLINRVSQLQGIVTFYSNQSRLASCTQEYT